MSDPTSSAPAVQSSQQLAATQGKIGLGKIVSALVCGWCASYFMNQLSLHGVNFEMTDVIPGVKVSSEVVKSTIEGALEATVVALTPQHFVAWTVDMIRWVRAAAKQISDAAHDPLPPSQE